MKILFAHNYLRPPSGENTVFENEKVLLQENHCQVVPLEIFNSEIDKLSLFQKIRLPMNILWNKEKYFSTRKLIKGNKPDVAHFHNTFPLFSPSVYYACKAENVPVVQTIHNHRLICPGAYLLRNSIICKDCINSSLLHGIIHKCYRESIIQTAGVASLLYVHRILRTWQKTINRYIVLTTFAKRLYSDSGLPEDKIVVKQNFVNDLSKRKYEDDDEYGVFIGRIGSEKGIENLLKALARIDKKISFKIIGGGELLDTCKITAQKESLTAVEFTGTKSWKDTIGLLSNASFLVLPSICYEGMPMVILEAMSLGKPVITSDLGGLPEIVRDGYNGFVVPSNNTLAFSERIRELSSNVFLRKELGKNARNTYEEHYTPSKNFEMIMAIYQNVIAEQRNENE